MSDNTPGSILLAVRDHASKEATALEQEAAELDRRAAENRRRATALRALDRVASDYFNASERPTEPVVNSLMRDPEGRPFHLLAAEEAGLAFPPDRHQASRR